MALEITLAGDVTIGDTTSTSPARRLAGNRDRVALALLTLERHRGVTRESLADAVWPEDMPATWASALRNVISRVRAVAMAALSTDEDPIAATEGGRYRLRLPDNAVVDVEHAEAAVVAAREALSSGRGQEAWNLATTAAACLATPFLPEQDGDWATTQRERYGELHVTALELASQAALMQGDTAGSLDAANDAITHAPLRESAHRLAMAAHLAGGNRAEALRTYQQLRRRLAEELGVDPAPETETAYVELLGSPAPPADTRRDDEAVRPRRTAPFVNRQRELQLLEDAWAATKASGRGRVALLLGEAGIGKTRLASEAAQRIAADGGLVLFGHCDSDSGIAYQPLAEALENLVAALPEDDIPRLDAPTQRQLATVFPCFGKVAQPQRGADRAELSTAVAELLVHTARRRPMLVVLDDLQWMEADTVVVLLDLVRRVRQAPLLTIAIVRYPPTPSELFHGTLHSLDREVGPDRVELAGLDETNVRELVAAVNPTTGAHVSDLARKLWSDTSGNPYMVLELLQELDGDSSVLDESASLPRRLTDLIQVRLGALDPPGRELLRAAAVVGRSFELDVAMRTADMDDVTALDALEDALDSGLVREVAVGTYRFTHDIVQRTLYEHMSDARRRRMHARCADAIESLSADEVDAHAAAMARHALLSAQTSGDPRAVHWARAAAAQALARSAPSEALRLYQEALRHAPADDLSLRTELTAELGLAHRDVDEEAAADALIDAAVLARRSHRLDVATSVALALADLARRRPEISSEALALVTELAMAPTQGSPPATDDGLLRARLLARYVELQPDAAELPADRSADAVAVLMRRLAELGGPNQLDDRIALASELAAVAAVAAHPIGQLAAGHHTAMVAALTGDEATVNSAIDPARFGESPMVELLCGERAVAVAVTQGDFDEARALAAPLWPPRREDGASTPADSRDAGVGSVVLGGPPPGAAVGPQLLVADWLQGRLDQHNSTASVERHPAQRALVELAKGERGHAHLTVRALASGAQPLAQDDSWLHESGILALAAVELRDASTAAAVHNLLSPYPDLHCGLGYRSFVGTMRFHLGRLAAVAGDWAEAERQLTAALTQLTAMQARPWVALTQGSLADVLDKRGRSSDRDWIAALRSEATWSTRTLGLRT